VRGGVGAGGGDGAAGADEVTVGSVGRLAGWRRRRAGGGVARRATAEAAAATLRAHIPAAAGGPVSVRPVSRPGETGGKVRIE
jgi:hypothetical protein